MRERFRFENLEVWKQSVELTDPVLKIARRIHENKDFGLSNQLFRAMISVSSNIAEGSGSASSRDFANFLNISHRSAFECVNLLHMAEMVGALDPSEKEELITRLDRICRQLQSFRKHLLEKSKEK